MKSALRNEIRRCCVDKPPLTPRMEQHKEKVRAICANPVVEAAFNEAIAHVTSHNQTREENIWQDATIEEFIFYFRAWLSNLPNATSSLDLISLTWFYLNNYHAFFFLHKFKSRSQYAREYTNTEIFDWVAEFILIRGEFMDSPASNFLINDWCKEPNIYIDDFIVPDCGFKSFNEFFSRRLKVTNDYNPRPIAEGDSIVNASADSIINLIISDLSLDTKLDVKGRQMSMKECLMILPMPSNL